MIEIPRPEEDRRLAVLLGRGTAPGWPRRSADRFILLHRAALCLAPGESLDERALSGRLNGWLAGEAANLGLDAAELRRALVDEGFLARDRAGRAYRRSNSYRARVRFESDAAASPDLAAPFTPSPAAPPLAPPAPGCPSAP